DWKMPAAAAAAILVAYLPVLGAGRAVFGFLPGYAKEEGLLKGSGFFLWNVMRSVAPPIGDTGAVPYLLFAAAAIAALAVYVLSRDKSGDQYIGSAAALAVAATILLSPHYPWYFAWLVPFLCFAPYPSVLYPAVPSPKGTGSLSIGRSTDLTRRLRSSSSGFAAGAAPPASSRWKRERRGCRRSWADVEPDALLRPYRGTPRAAERNRARLPLSRDDEPVQSSLPHLSPHLRGPRAAGR